MSEQTTEVSEERRCQGWRRQGGFMALDPVTWTQCSNEGIVMLHVSQEGEEPAALPVCQECWKEALCNEEIVILSISPMPTKET